MAGRHFITRYLLLLLVAFPYIEASEENAPKTRERKIEVVVEAMVYCQSCEHLGTRSLNGAKPIPSAKVSVASKSYKGQVIYYKVFEADNNGYVYAPLEGFKMEHYILDHPLHSCYAKLVWSPLESNVNYTLNGAPLRYESKRLHGSRYEAVIYAVAPLAFRPSDCSQTIPTTHY